MKVELFKIPDEITSAVDAFAKEEMIQAISVHEKQARSEAMDSVAEKPWLISKALGRRIGIRARRKNQMG